MYSNLASLHPSCRRSHLYHDKPSTESAYLSNLTISRWMGIIIISSHHAHDRHELYITFPQSIWKSLKWLLLSPFITTSTPDPSRPAGLHRDGIGLVGTIKWHHCVPRGVNIVWGHFRIRLSSATNLIGLKAEVSEVFKQFQVYYMTPASYASTDLF